MQRCVVAGWGEAACQRTQGLKVVQGEKLFWRRKPFFRFMKGWGGEGKGEEEEENLFLKNV